MKITWEIIRLETRVKYLRWTRNKLEGKLKRCEIPASRDNYMLKIELINIRIQDMGEMPYGNAGFHRAKF